MMAEAGTVAFACAGLMYFIRRPFQFVYVLPAIHVATALAAGFLAPQTWAIISPLAMLFVLALTTYVILLHARGVPRAALPIVLFLGYTFVMAANSLDVVASYTGLVKLVVTLSAVPLGIVAVRTHKGLANLCVGAVVAGGLIGLNLVIAQIYSFGESPYLEDAFYLGLGGVEQVTFCLYVLLLLPLLMRCSTSRMGRTALIVAGLAISLIIVLLFKRVLLGALVAAGLVYLIMAPRRIQLIRRVALPAGVLMLAAFVLFGFKIGSMYESIIVPKAEVRLAYDLTSEGKFVTDLKWYMEDVANTDIKRLLFGTNLLNEWAYFGRNRSIHVDYIRLAHGLGIVGLAGYLWVMIMLVVSFEKRFRRSRRCVLLLEVRAVFYSVWVVGMVVGLSGGIVVIAFRSLMFLMLGAMIGVVSNPAVAMRKSSHRNVQVTTAGVRTKGVSVA